MDLVDLIVEKRFLGQEFLTWLWWKSEERGGSVELVGVGDIIVVFEMHMLLEAGEGETNEKIICSGLQSELQEARTGLKMGKKLEQARLKVSVNDMEWNFTLAGSVMEFRNLKLPKTENSVESGNPEETEGMILERIYLIEEIDRIITGLFKQFLEIRVGSSWPQEVEKLRNWVKIDMSM